MLKAWLCQDPTTLVVFSTTLVPIQLLQSQQESLACNLDHLLTNTCNIA